MLKHEISRFSLTSIIYSGTHDGLFQMHLSWVDYAVLAFLLGLSVSIGIYQGCFRSRQLTTNEFLIADGQMRVRRRGFVCEKSIMIIDFTNSYELIGKSDVRSGFIGNSVGNLFLWNDVFLLE